MRASTLPRTLLTAAVLALALPALAQTANPQKPEQAPSAAAPADAERQPPETVRPVERITHEDAYSRIDELKVGSQTRSIEVTPKNGAPAYEIAPEPGADNATNGAGGSSGRSRWRLISF